MDIYDDKYPNLASLLGGYFHQDFDIHGDTLEEIVGLYRKEGTQAEIDGLRKDIQKFLAAFDDAHIKSAFVRIFHPDIDSEGWGLSVREWLLKINELLA